ncbi:MAG: hypothetical protein HYY24_11520 [Verrucomicrobia bacterium]|nr:hypothetical protein [Verrucomicrobiota bacterium]
MKAGDTTQGVIRAKALLALAAVFVASCLALLLAQEFRVQHIKLGDDGRVHLGYAADPASYYILYRGEAVTSVTQPSDLALGSDSTGEFVQPVRPSAATFFRIRQVPVAQPLDADADGIDDVFELRRRTILDPLNAADAGVDADNDGRSNLDEYRLGTDPAVPNQPPSVTLTKPAPASEFRSPADILLEAEATDPDGRVVLVAFFANGAKVGEATAGPFTFSWQDVAPGSYSLSAQATDDFGASASSPEVAVTVLPPNEPPSIRLVSPPADAVFTSPARITLEADATDADGTVTLVEFFAGASKLGQATAPPYTFDWQDVPAGSYELTARATDNRGAQTTSAPVKIRVNSPPTVRLTAPADKAVFAAPATVILTAEASDTDGSIAKVEFFSGANKLGEAMTAPFTFAWAGVGPGSYPLAAKATDDLGATTTSTEIIIIVNALPTVRLTSPAPDSTFTAPASITLTAEAGDLDGQVTLVEFFAGASKIGQAVSVPFTVVWEDVPVGLYTLTARATDNLGASVLSAPVGISVNPLNHPPTVSVSKPFDNSVFLAPASFTLAATATDADAGDVVTLVEFFANDQKIGEATIPPFTTAWAGVPEGNYLVRAKATDKVGAFSLSLAIKLTVVAPTAPPLTTIESLPSSGEQEVAVTRETIIRFSNPLSDTALVMPEQLYAEFGGRRLLSRVELSTDRRTATLFYLEHLPGGARVRVTFDADQVFDLFGQAVDADGDGTAGGTATIDFETLGLTTLSDTTVCGRVFASELAKPANGDQTMSVNVPLAGVVITADGLEETVRAVTDQNGDFRLLNAPAGPFFVHIDGRTVRDDAKGIRYPDLKYYPFVGKQWESIPGQEVNIGEVYLPLVSEATLVPASATEDTHVTFPPNVLAEHPELEGVTLTVPANSLFSDNGTRGGRVGIAPVPPDRLPGPLPMGLQFPLVITVQTDGAQNFDRPVPVCFPNLPDPVTGRPLPPGAQSALWSFNHDTGEWEIRGPMTASADGRLVCTDPGIGILAPGWHGWRLGFVFIGGVLVAFPVLVDYSQESNQEPPNCQPSDSTDPIYLFSGEFHESVVDLHIQGRGMDFTWTRKYRSKIGASTRQGNGWDFSYNISLEADGTDLLLHDGNTRLDRYRPQNDGTYIADGFFRELVRNPDGSWTLTFEDKTQWVFQALDGSPAAGRLLSVTDRNSNRLALHYDALGRMDRVTDTLDRDILIAYNADGFISAVTDFAGRSVRYDYYDGVEPGGSFGDLKSVRTPVVVGTPNGNDFPDGKKTTYTYSTGFADERLNHNLLTITDGRRNDPSDPTFGQGPYLVNTYANTTDPNDLNFDRVVRQILAGDIMDIVYVPLLPSEANGDVVMKAILNDRNGNVKEYFFDSRNRMARTREFTGRANPREPTTEFGNRPTGKLRPDDPEYFETIFEWNSDSLQTRIIYPNGNVTEYVHETDLSPPAAGRARGNLRIVRYRPGTHTPAGDQTVIEEAYEYDTDFASGCCGFNFITRSVDGRGNETRFSYDERGNLLRVRHRIASIVEDFEYNAFGQMTAHVLPANGSGHRRRDVSTYYDNGPQRGYLRQQIADATGFALTTTFEYDTVGNVVRAIDPRGRDAQYVVNSLNHIVRGISREVRDGSGVRYQADLYYDANNNLARLDVQNINDQGVLEPNTHFTARFEFEMLDFLIRQTQEVDPARSVVTEFGYDANRNRILTRAGEATSGRQTNNVVRVRYDERDMLFQVVLGAGDANQSTSQYDYDRNGNLVRFSQGLEGGPRITAQLYDGYDRLVETRDSMGNVVQQKYDANGNPTSRTVLGELLDVPGASSNVRLAEQAYRHDELDRLVRSEAAFFDAGAQAPVGDGVAATELFYSDSSQVVRVSDDNGHQMLIAYDTANRPRVVTDAKGNTITPLYNANSKVISLTQVEKSDLGGPDETFIARAEYDNLDRLVRTVDLAGNTIDYAHDSRNNLALRVDALRRDPAAPGNRVRYEYDGLNRLIRTSRFLTDDGAGSGAVVGAITTSQAWDDSSRLIAQSDDRGNATTYGYDALNRPILTQFADGTLHTLDYDVHDNPIRQTDANGSVITSTFDQLDRLIRQDIQIGPGVSADTSFESYQYDGLSRLIRAVDDDSVVIFGYDSLSHVTSESLNGRMTSSRYDAVGNRLSVAYPGGRTVHATYDELNRTKTISDQAGLIATRHFIGQSRVERLSYVNQTRCTYQYDAAKRISRIVHALVSDGVTAVFADRSYTWDPMFNKTSRRDNLRSQAHDYAYDSVYRLVRSTQAPGATVTYAFDGTGNRLSVTGDSGSGSYAMDATLPEPADAEQNQYTTTPFGVHQYDKNGNLTRTEHTSSRRLAYDYRNRTVSHSRDGVTATYAYDALGRRIKKAVSNPVPQITSYFYDGWQLIEEQDSTGVTEATCVYGPNLDEVLTMRRGASDLYYHADDLHNVTELSDSVGRIAERYEYEDYGKPAFFGASGDSIGQSAVGNPYLFTGRRYDEETSWYEFRTRYFDPLSGRFTTRDTIGIWGDPANVGNGYAYLGNNPWTSTDPMGLSVGKRIKLALGASWGASKTLFGGTFEFFNKGTQNVIYQTDGWALGLGPGLLVRATGREAYREGETWRRQTVEALEGMVEDPMGSFVRPFEEGADLYNEGRPWEAGEEKVGPAGMRIYLVAKIPMAPGQLPGKACPMIRCPPRVAPRLPRAQPSTPVRADAPTRVRPDAPTRVRAGESSAPFNPSTTWVETFKPGMTWVQCSRSPAAAALRVRSAAATEWVWQQRAARRGAGVPGQAGLDALLTELTRAAEQKFGLPPGYFGPQP